MGGKQSKGKEKQVTLARELDVKKAQKDKSIVTILLQGAGESGKSTVLKQFKVIHGKGYDTNERRMKRHVVLNNLIVSTSEIIEAMEAEGIRISNPEAGKIVDEYMEKTKQKDCPKTESLSEEMAGALLSLLEDKVFTSSIMKYGQSYAQDAYFDILEKVADYPTWGGPSWLPNNDDILKTRVRTSGVTLNNYFKVDKTVFNIVDVGGQTNERKRYLQLFTKANHVLFVTSLAEYDLKLFESPTEDRLNDSLQLFKTTCLAKELRKSPIALFLNKKDIFLKKYVDMKIPLPEISGFRAPPKVEDEEDLENCPLALTWFSDLFLSYSDNGRVNKSDIYVTTAVNTSVMTTVIDSLSNAIINQVLKDMAILPP